MARILCRDCDNLVPISYATSAGSLILYACRSPKNITGKTSLVTGYTLPLHDGAEACRLDSTACGPDAVWFSAMPGVQTNGKWIGSKSTAAASNRSDPTLLTRIRAKAASRLTGTKITLEDL